jgi:Xaa-Pro aminopeptidase
MKVTTILVILCWTLLLPSHEVQSQTFRYEVHDTDLIPSSVYKERRERLRKSVPLGSVIAVMAADVRNRQNDVDYEYRQNSNLLYLTGYPDPNAVLLLSDAGFVVGGRTVKEILFVKERDPRKEQWSGTTAGTTEAMEVYGLDTALAIEELVKVLDSRFGDERSEGVTRSKDTLYVDGWPTKSVDLPLLGRRHYVDGQTKKELRAAYGDLNIIPRIDALVAMREIKDTAELRLLRKAIDITVEGHRNAIRNTTPDMKEYQIEALMEFSFKNLGAEDVGYPSIVGSSYNACILHYISNRRAARTGDLILADCGAEYHGYTADVTRTFPVKGTFTKEQRIIYNIVLEAQDAGIAACRAGAPFKAPHDAALNVIKRRLLEIGVLTHADSVTKYFMHGTSHYLGLDVHDPGRRGPLEPNTVITVEPGIYIAEGSPCDPKWWNIGVRIEDDILITESGPENLSGSLERTADAIEALMRK